jgi:hypothetical protein
MCLGLARRREALGQDLLARLRAAFLERLYRSMLESSLAFWFVAKLEARPVWFVLGTTRTSAMFRTVLRTSGPALLRCVLPGLLAHPVPALRLAEAVLYPRRLPLVPEQAELLVIGLREDFRNGL